jgi:hypothetical protein
VTLGFEGNEFTRSSRYQAEFCDKHKEGGGEAIKTVTANMVSSGGAQRTHMLSVFCSVLAKTTAAMHYVSRPLTLVQTLLLLQPTTGCSVTRRVVLPGSGTGSCI